MVFDLGKILIGLKNKIDLLRRKSTILHVKHV